MYDTFWSMLKERPDEYERMAKASLSARFRGSHISSQAWGEIWSLTLIKCAPSYDPDRASLQTYLCWQVQSIGQTWMRRNKRARSIESTFSQLEDEDGRSPVDEVAIEDAYNFPDKLKEQLACLDYRHFETVAPVKSKTYGELIALLALGYKHQDISAEWGISNPTLRKCLAEVAQCLKNMGVISGISYPAVSLQLSG